MKKLQWTLAAGATALALTGASVGLANNPGKGAAKKSAPAHVQPGGEARPATPDNAARPGAIRPDPMVGLDQIRDWSEASRKAARALMTKYGPPTETTPTMWIWHKNGPWKRTVVYKDEVPHHFPVKHTDVVEQFIDYKVPVDKYDELAAYDGSVVAQRTVGELSARCDKEEMNFLAINLAHDVATGKRSVEEARRMYGDSAMKFMKGQSSPYVEKIQFDIPTSAGDTDKPLKM